MNRKALIILLSGLTGVGLYAGVAGLVVPVAATFSVTGWTAVPGQINHQGVVTVGGVRHTGSGQFRFAIIDVGTGQNLWTNDGTQIGSSSMPTAAVSLMVSDGIYNLSLGNANLTNMTALSPSIFANTNTALRIWFDDGAHGNHQLSPDHPLTSAPYAMTAPDVAITGEVKLWAGAIAGIPSGWLACDGAAVSRTTYGKLFAAIGVIHGSGDGSSTFNLPDLRDRLPIGARQDAGGVPKTNVTGSLTQTGGQANRTLTATELPAHSHSGATGGGNPVFYRVVGAAGTGAVANHLSGYSTPASYVDHTDADYPAAGHTHNFTTSTAGSGQAFSTLDPYLAMVYIIKY